MVENLGILRLDLSVLVDVTNAVSVVDDIRINNRGRHLDVERWSHHLNI